MDSFNIYNGNKKLECIENEFDNYQQAFFHIFKNQVVGNSALANKFYLYVNQFYNNYGWIDNSDDIYSNVLLEIAVKSLSKKTLEDDFNNLYFQNIIIDFLIRCGKYSLVEHDEVKKITTSLGTCDKSFNKFLEKGYIIDFREEVFYISKPVKGKNFRVSTFNPYNNTEINNKNLVKKREKISN